MPEIPTWRLERECCKLITVGFTFIIELVYTLVGKNHENRAGSRNSVSLCFSIFNRLTLKSRKR